MVSGVTCWFDPRTKKMRTMVETGLPPTNVHGLCLSAWTPFSIPLLVTASQVIGEEAAGGPSQSGAVLSPWAVCPWGLPCQNVRQPLRPWSILWESSHPDRQSGGHDPSPHLHGSMTCFL